MQAYYYIRLMECDRKYFKLYIVYFHSYLPMEVTLQCLRGWFLSGMMKVLFCLGKINTINSFFFKYCLHDCVLHCTIALLNYLDY